MLYPRPRLRFHRDDLARYVETKKSPAWSVTAPAATWLETADAPRGGRTVAAQPSSTTEGQNGGNIRFSTAAVEHAGSEISLVRNATVISYGAQADGIVTIARRANDAAGSDQVLLAITRDDYTLERSLGWETLGMRGTCSAGFEL